MTDTSDSDLVSGAKNGKDGQKELLAAGSKALLTNSPSEAISKYKSVLDKMTCKASQKTPITHLVLRYALCIAYLKSNDFTNICEAAETLLDMIDSGYASKLPALYLAIAKVYFALNRFNSALEFIEKGLKAIHNNSKIKQQSWPGLTKAIDETGKDSLHKELLNLQIKCKNVQPPDAVCQYEKCLEFSTHVIPAREIYFSDLDFAPFLSLQCDENCKFGYHDLCWEHMKNIHLKEPQELLGTTCPTDSCTSSVFNNSVIVGVNLIGSDGFDKPLKTWGGTNNSNCKPRNKMLEQTYSPIKQESTNGSSIKSSEGRSLVETNSKVISSDIVASRPEDFKAASADTKNYAVLHSYHTPAGKKTAVVPLLNSPCAYQYPQQPMYHGFPLIQRPTYLPVPVRNHFMHGSHVPMPFQFGHGAQTSPLMVPYRPYMVSVPQRPQVILPPSQNYRLNCTPPVRPSIPVGVNQSLPEEGAMQTHLSHKVSGHSLSSHSPRKEENFEAVKEPPAASIVGDFKTSVKNLADEDKCWKKKIAPANTSSDEKEVTMKQVVQDFQRLVQDVAGNGSKVQANTQKKPPHWEESASNISAFNDKLKPTDINSNLSASSSSTPSAVAIHFKELVSQLAKQDNPHKTDAPLKSSDVKCSPSTTLNQTPPDEASNISLNDFLSSNSAPLVQALSLHSFHSLKPSRTTADHLITQSSTLQAKSKNFSMKDEEIRSDQSVLLSSSIANSLCSSEDDVRSEASDSSKLSALVETLNKCREMKFGYSDEEYRSPQFPCFGHPFEEFSTYLQPGEIDIADKDTAEFVFSLYQSMFDKNGHYRIEDLQETWKPTVSDLGIPETFTDKYKSVSEFLLKSERFAAIDDVIGTSDLLPDMFLKAEVEITQTVSYLLFSQVANPRCKDPDRGSDIWKTKANNNNCDSITRISSLQSANDHGKDALKENSGKFVESSSAQTLSKDKNDNPISNVALLANSNSYTAINGSLEPTSTPFVPKDTSFISSQEGEVYLSEEDDEEDRRSSLFLENDEPLFDPSVINLIKREEISKPDVTHQHSQTDEVTDVEKENLNVHKVSLLQEISGLEYEKTELLQRIETLQSELDNTRTDLESVLATSTKQLQDFQDNIQKKSEEYMEVQETNGALEQQLNELHELTKEKDSQVLELEATLDKLRRSHAKEINNFGQRLREERKLKEEEFKDQLKLKDQKYIQLWKEYCDYKIKKFNHLSNDRINVLFQLKDMMSDSIRPTKSDIKSLIENYEEEMISVSKKNNEVNNVCDEELEKLSKDINYRPSVISIPDTMNNMVYPPEGAFEYLQNILKSKQDDFAPSRNHFSPAVSRFHRSFASNGLQSSSLNREPEQFSSMANTSLFGQGLNETSHLWNNAFPTSAHSTALSYDVGNTNGPHLPLHQGFGAASSMMSQQPGVNLMPTFQHANIPFPPSAAQPTSVQAIMGSARSTPSPLLSFSNVNGMAFNSNAAAGSAVGSLGAIQKPIVNVAPPPNPISKPMIPAALTPASAIVLPQTASPQGAISKPRVQTATAAMTPIVPSKPIVRPVSKVPKTNESNYEKLMRNLQKMFPTRNDADLTQALKMARHRNGGTLGTLTHSEIVSKVDEILSKQGKQTAMGWEKFGQAAWGTAAKTSVVEWEGAKDDLDECCICMTALNSQEVYTLECKHAFHKECIRKWLLQDGVCPMCRVHSTMLDEFPPLG